MKLIITENTSPGKYVLTGNILVHKSTKQRYFCINAAQSQASPSYYMAQNGLQ